MVTCPVQNYRTACMGTRLYCSNKTVLLKRILYIYVIIRLGRINNDDRSIDDVCHDIRYQVTKPCVINSIPDIKFHLTIEVKSSSSPSKLRIYIAWLLVHSSFSLSSKVQRSWISLSQDLRTVTMECIMQWPSRGDLTSVKREQNISSFNNLVKWSDKSGARLQSTGEFW